MLDIPTATLADLGRLIAARTGDTNAAAIAEARGLTITIPDNLSREELALRCVAVLDAAIGRPKP